MMRTKERKSKMANSEKKKQQKRKKSRAHPAEI